MIEMNERRQGKGKNIRMKEERGRKRKNKREGGTESKRCTAAARQQSQEVSIKSSPRSSPSFLASKSSPMMQSALMRSTFGDSMC